MPLATKSCGEPEIVVHAFAVVGQQVGLADASVVPGLVGGAGSIADRTQTSRGWSPRLASTAESTPAI